VNDNGNDNNNSISSIFKAYDIRGKVGSELNAEVVGNIGQAFASWLPDGAGGTDGSKGTIAVGRDMRPDSAELATALIEGVRAQGYDVYDIGQVTSDMIYFVVGNFQLAGGAMITASHNPGEYNGIKLCREEARPVGQDTGLFDIRDAVLAADFTPATYQGTVEDKDVVEAWIQHTLSFIEADKLKPLSIAVDAGNGMAGKIFPELEPYVPWDVTEMYFELDGTFPNHEANPLNFETLTDMIKVIQDNQLDGGIAFDGDGDRAFLVDETGTVIPGNVMISLISEYFLGRFPSSAILYDVRVSKSVRELIEAKGGKPIRTKVGHSFIKQIMREENAPFGGEVSGHFYFRDNFFADSGLIAAVISLYVAGLPAYEGKKLSEIREMYTKYPSIPETNFVVEDKASALSRLETAFTNAQFDRLDGLTGILDNGSWFNVRASNTEPVLRLNAEATTQEDLDALVEKATTVIQGA
jgi:phosphomannomutase